jgi:hypothetical protein
VGDSSGPAPAATQTPAGSANPLVRSMRPNRFGFLRLHEDAAAAQAPEGDAP